MKKFSSGNIYHIFNKSIANFKIFNSSSEYLRFINLLNYYNDPALKVSFSKFINNNNNFFTNLLLPKEGAIIKFLAYCIMPDHFHLLIKVLTDNCLSKYLSDVQNSYTRFFNLKHHRKGPLWQSSFKNVIVKSNEQLLHVSRYAHLNPTTSNLVKKPEDWEYSSYREYINNKNTYKNIKEISINNCIDYKKFVEDNINYQRKLKIIKKLIID